MGAYDGLFPARFLLPDRDNGRVYVKGQPAFNFTKEFTLKDLMRLNKDARRDGKDHVYIRGGRKDISVRLDLWYSEALVRNEMVTN